jgi:hypothetical protein
MSSYVCIIRTTVAINFVSIQMNKLDRIASSNKRHRISGPVNRAGSEDSPFLIPASIPEDTDAPLTKDVDREAEDYN